MYFIRKSYKFISFFSTIETFHPLPTLDLLQLVKKPTDPSINHDASQLISSEKPHDFLNNQAKYDNLYDQVLRLHSEADISKSKYASLSKTLESHQSYLIQASQSSDFQRVLKVFKISYILIKSHDPLEFLSKYLENLKKKGKHMNLYEITEILLTLQEIYKNSLSQIKKTQSFQNVLALIAYPLISYEFVPEDALFLLQIFYILVRFDYDSKVMFTNMVSSMKTFGSLERLLEMQFTSFILSLIRLNTRYPGMVPNIKDYFDLLEEKFMHRVYENSLHYKRVPPVLYTLACMDKPPQKSKGIILSSLSEYADKFSKEEIGSIIYSLTKLDLDPYYDIYPKLMEKIELIENPSIYSHAELINLLVSLRRFKPMTLRKDKNTIFLLEFRRNLIKELNNRWKSLNDKAKLMYTYEILMKQDIDDEDLDLMLYERYMVEEAPLKDLDNYDLITIGHLFAQFRKNLTIHDDFVIRYKEVVTKRQFIKEIEKKRVNIVLKYLENRAFLK